MADLASALLPGVKISDGSKDAMLEEGRALKGGDGGASGPATGAGAGPNSAHSDAGSGAPGAGSGAGAPPAKKKRGDGRLVLFGVLDITHWSENSQAALLSMGALCAALGFSALQEGVFRVPGFHYPAFMTFLTTVTYIVCAFIERASTGETQRKALLRDYAMLSVWTMAGSFLTNLSLHYLSYPLRVMAKSSKLIPVMLVRTVVMQKRYSRLEYFSAGVLVVAISVFTMGDAHISGGFDWRGLVLLGLGMFADAITANYEEARFFKALDCSQAEVMLYSSCFGALWSLGIMFATGESFHAVAHALEHPEVVVMSASFSTLGFVSTTCILVLIGHFGSDNAEIVKSLRKVFSVTLSFIIYRKPVGVYHVWGGILFAVAVGLGSLIKMRRNAAKREAQRIARESGQHVEEEEEYHGGGF